MPVLRLPKPYSKDELGRLYAGARDRPELSAAMAFLEETGLRVSEFASVTAGDASRWPVPPWWCRKCVCTRHGGAFRVVGKGEGGRTTGGGKERTVVLTRRALLAADTLLAHPSQNGRILFLLPWTDRGLRWLLEQLGTRVGVHAHPHRFRHTFCSQLAEAGVPAEVIADMAGHESVDTTRYYLLLASRTKIEALRRRARRS